MVGIAQIIALLRGHEHRARRGLHLTPSENVLSPLARLPFALDCYSRYFLDDLRLFGSWCFRDGRALGEIEQQVLIPVTKRLAHAQFVNVRPISGISGMTLVLAGLCTAGDTVLSVPIRCGGHASTSVVAKRLGLKNEWLPFSTPHDLDLDVCASQLQQIRPALIYLDQSTLLFPIDPAPLRALVDEHSPATLIHYDSSHLNGLILAGAIFNPLDRGADCFGGSTHKTLPGPHKAFVATNREDLARRIEAAADHFVSHHHMADVVSLAITLVELRDCGGERYARNVIANAKALGVAMSQLGVEVAALDRGITDCHQVWIAPAAPSDVHRSAEELFACGVTLNCFPSLPAFVRPAFRLSTAELTRLGAVEADMRQLAEILNDVFRSRCSPARIAERVRELAQHLNRPRYCYDVDDFPGCEELSKQRWQVACPPS